MSETMWWEVSKDLIIAVIYKAHVNKYILRLYPSNQLELMLNPFRHMTLGKHIHLAVIEYSNLVFFLSFQRRQESYSTTDTWRKRTPSVMAIVHWTCMNWNLNIVGRWKKKLKKINLTCDFFVSGETFSSHNMLFSIFIKIITIDHIKYSFSHIVAMSL